MQPSEAFQQALNLLDQEPLPADTESRLADLERRIRPDEAELFGDLWEAFYAAGGQEAG